eukprot:Skav219656  [mRNA]  locus=scaffold953:100976:103599:+ [translate_table: standard]
MALELPKASMKSSLAKLSQLPGKTRVFCGHEYTVGNLEYAISVEPSNTLLQSRLAEAKDGAHGQVPGKSLHFRVALQELEHNVFVRASLNNVSDEEMGKLRRGGSG